jgi:hypothetical protein
VQHLQSLIQQRHQKASLPPPPNLYYAPCTCIITFMTTAVQNQKSLLCAQSVITRIVGQSFTVLQSKMVKTCKTLVA